ncbi:uncharacterized protein LOC128293765 [Gossypium arboreum]|uniref:uncharacterized protein LOC128293765 n=1 Tax=Gossypium arboreum TaxID=29729 RepID=UPI0022F1CC15|nr:uncharacterized protein LOC128293765 [Gossypium arboreum]
MSTPQIEQRANVEIYFDAAYDQQTSKSTSSLVCKGSGGRILASKSAFHSNVVSPFAAEAHAGLQAVRLRKQMGFTILHIISDSKTVLKKCQSFYRDSSIIRAFISYIQEIKSHFQEIQFQFIPRTENTCVDLIAKEALNKGEDFTWREGFQKPSEEKWSSYV